MSRSGFHFAKLGLSKFSQSSNLDHTLGLWGLKTLPFSLDIPNKE